MARFWKSILGGVIIILAALAIGVFHNALRKNKIPLILASDFESGRSLQRNKTSPLTPSKDERGEAPLSPADSTSQVKAANEGILTLKEAKRLFDEEEATFIDARSERSFAEGHISGAINIPYDKLSEYYETLTSRISHEETAVCYCWGPSCDFSDNLASELRLMGYENVLIFRGGWEKWTENNLPTEISETNNDK